MAWVWVEDDLMDKFGVQCLGGINVLLKGIYNSNAYSHVKAVISEQVFAQEAATKHGINCEKVEDQERAKRFDFLGRPLAMRQTLDKLRLEVKMASSTGHFDVSFRDYQYHTINGESIKTHLRHLEQSFDYVVVNLYNITGSWTDFAYVRFRDLPTLVTTSKHGKVRKDYQRYLPETRRQLEEQFFAGGFNFKNLPTLDNLEQVKKDFYGSCLKENGNNSSIASIREMLAA